MCAPSDDLTQAREEDIVVRNACMISRVLEKDGRVAGVEFFDVSSFCFDDSGQARIEPVSDERHTLGADTVILAVGVQPELDFIRGSGIDMNPNGTITVDPVNLTTSVKGVYAAGDAACGPSIVARAVGLGRETAVLVNQYLMGGFPDEDALIIGEDSGIRAETIARPHPPHVVKFAEMFNPEYYGKAARGKTAVSSRISFMERDSGFDAATAVQEAGRCFHCGHCHKCGKCVEDCPGLILGMVEKGPEVLYPDECWHCGNCRISCPNAAISYEFPLYALV
jgi:heterodisulfide reductase subunit A-like polyferredoxin